MTTTNLPTSDPSGSSPEKPVLLDPVTIKTYLDRAVTFIRAATECVSDVGASIQADAPGDAAPIVADDLNDLAAAMRNLRHADMFLTGIATARLEGIGKDDAPVLPEQPPAPPETPTSDLEFCLRHFASMVETCYGQLVHLAAWLKTIPTEQLRTGYDPKDGKPTGAAVLSLAEALFKFASAHSQFTEIAVARCNEIDPPPAAPAPPAVTTHHKWN